MAQYAEERGYSLGTKKSLAEDDYRNQTRYFYLYMLFRVTSQVLRETPEIDPTTRHEFYQQLIQLRDDHLARPSEETPFLALLDIADTVVATYMGMASQLKWFFDRNAFLKSQDLLNQERILQASGQLLLKEKDLRQRALAVLKV